jgi:hypothetical protein
MKSESCFPLTRDSQVLESLSAKARFIRAQTPLDGLHTFLFWPLFDMNYGQVSE